MAQHLQLSVVDQSPVHAGGTAADALRETIALAVATEAMELYQTTDISIVTICYNFKDRVRSYELVAEACELKG